MVGRGPVQVMYPSNNTSNNSTTNNYSTSEYSNNLQQTKMESYDIPNNIPIKQETTFITPLTHQVDTKYSSQYTTNYSTGLYSNDIPQETGIYFLPLEQLSNNPYKQQAESTDTYLFQKYPQTADTNWTNGDGFYSNNTPNMPTTYLAYDKEKTSQKEDDILAQLLDEGGLFEEFGNNLYIPSNDILIPVTNDHLNCYSPPQNASPMQESYPPFNNEPLLEGSSSSPLSDPLVSGLNEPMTSPPCNEITQFNNEIPPSKVDGDLQELLGELFGQDDFTLSNTFNTHSNHSNIIPTMTTATNTIPPLSFDIEEDDDTSNNHVTPTSEEDMIIPSNDLFPTTKKPRMSTNDDDTSHNYISLDKPSKRKPRPRLSSFSSSSSSPPPASSPHSTDTKSHDHKPSSSSSNSGTMLFGQHENEIISKLLIHRDSKVTKPITRDKLVTMPVEEFNTLLDEASLTEIEVAFMKEWRRRGKNKMAAQIARKRKREELFELEDDMDTLRQRRVQLQQSVENLTVLIASYKRRAETAETNIYKRYTATHGSLVSKDTHTIHVTDDSKTMLIPRMSNQILLV